MDGNQSTSAKPHWQFVDNDCIEVRLVEKRLLGGLKRFKLTEWTRASGASGMASLLSKIQAAAEDGLTAEDGRPLAQVFDDNCRLHPAIVAQLSTVEAEAVGLPPATHLRLDLRSKNRLDETSFHIKATWRRPGGGSVLASQTGALLNVEGQFYRIPDPLYSLSCSARLLGESSQNGGNRHICALAELKSTLNAIDPNIVAQDTYLEDIRIYYAGAFSLKLDARPDGLQIEPVLFARTVIGTEDGSRHEEDDALLPPKFQRIFAQDRFARTQGDRRAYALDDGAYVFVDETIRPLLKEVRRVQASDSETRRQFAANPRAELKRLLAGAIDDDVIEQVFVETEQFSERVTGVDEWRVQVLPWIKNKPNTWMPEKFGLRVGPDTFVAIAPAQVEPLIASLESAIAVQARSVEFENVQIPATPQALQSARDLKAVLDDVSARQSGATEKSETDAEPPGYSGRLFLQVHDNFEYVSFERSGAAGFSTHTDVEIPGRVATQLKPHQVEGVNWLSSAVLSGRRGVLLADDMGLGKTLQAIAFMAWLQDEAEHGRREKAPFLIVAPTALLMNWEAEITRHLAGERLGEILALTGATLNAAHAMTSGTDIRTGRSVLELSAWCNADVLLITYETMRDYHISLARQRFALVVFDEIQKLKNPTSQMSRAARTINAEFSLGMTGTPVENRIEDVWSIADVVSPGELDSNKAFSKTYGSNDESRLMELHARVLKSKGARPALMLRRMKEDNLPGLPAKQVKSYPIEMTSAQTAAYRNAINHALAQKSLKKSPRGLMLEVLHAMRGISLSGSDIDTDTLTDEQLLASSAKLKWLIGLLKEISAKREKALIFVESLALQARLAEILPRFLTLPRRPMRISGEIPGAKRQQIVDLFQSEQGVFDVLIISPKAGGVGLTLTAANHVIHLSRWWNPAVEDQATDRVYRIGQQRDVEVHIPLALLPAGSGASFDVKLDELLSRKRGLSRHMFAPPELEGDIEELFRDLFEEGGGPTPEPDVIQNTDPQATDESIVARKVGTLSIQSSAAEVLAKAQGETGVAGHRPPQFVGDRWVYAKRQPRDLDAVFACLSGARLIAVEYVDRYGASHQEAVEAMGHVLGAIARIAGPAQNLKIIFLSSDEQRSQQRGFVSTQVQIGELRKAVEKAGILPNQVRPHLIAQTYRQSDHGRSIRIRMETGGARRHLVWSPDNSVLAWVRPDLDLTVTCFEDVPQVASAR